MNVPQHLALNLSPLSQVSVSFAASPNAELICEVHTVDGKASRQVKATRSQDNGQWVFDLDLPTSGEYSLNIFAKEKGNDAEIFSVHSYLVQSDGRPDSVQTGETSGCRSGRHIMGVFTGCLTLFGQRSQLQDK